MLNIKIYKNKKGVLRVSMHANLDDLKNISSAKPLPPTLGSVPNNPMGNFVSLFSALRNLK